jgi:hypothetical protein
MVNAQQVDGEKDQQYRSDADASAPTKTPSLLAVVPPTNT